MSRQNVVADAFADLTPIDESTLIDESQLLDPIADDDDIDWKIDPFEMRPDSANPRDARRDPCHDQILRVAIAPGTAEESLQRVYRHLLYIGTVPARTGRTHGHRNRSSKVGGAAQPPPTSAPFR